MEEFLEVLSLQEQTVFLEIKRKQRAAAAGAAGSSVCSQEDMLEMMALQQKKAAFEKKWREAIANPNVRRPTVMELFGGLHYSEPLPPSPPPPLITMTVLIPPLPLRRPSPPERVPAPSLEKCVALGRRGGTQVMLALVPLEVKLI
ncbi:unnamed protein product [Cuscuta campestris]|uniref:Uncharacterized protein n=1 Tax=Cuscuta campestris TaxID=132261 RepID=A0A484KZN8_9ASTE|nr:unnamed protein product [Cuscuta campestris]